jgi:putative ABC transport system permease protein
MILAFAMVTPIAWWAMNKRIQGFAERTPISWWIFVLSGAGMLLATLLTSGYQTVQAAIANPAKILRTD